MTFNIVDIFITFETVIVLCMTKHFDTMRCESVVTVHLQTIFNVPSRVAIAVTPVNVNHTGSVVTIFGPTPGSQMQK